MTRLAASPHLLMLVAVAIFGANYVVGRGAVGEVPPYALGFVRWTGATLILAPFVWRRVGADRARLWRRWKLLLLCGILMPFLGAGIAYVALIETIAVNAGIIQTSNPMLTVLIAWIVLGERITALQAGGAALAIAGVLAIVTRGDPAALLALQCPNLSGSAGGFVGECVRSRGVNSNCFRQGRTGQRIIKANGIPV